MGRSAMRACRAEALDVRLVHYGSIKGDFATLETGKRRGGTKKKQ